MASTRKTKGNRADEKIQMPDLSSGRVRKILEQYEISQFDTIPGLKELVEEIFRRYRHPAKGETAPYADMNSLVKKPEHAEALMAFAKVAADNMDVFLPTVEWGGKQGKIRPGDEIGSATASATATATAEATADATAGGHGGNSGNGGHSGGSGGSTASANASVQAQATANATAGGHGRKPRKENPGNGGHSGGSGGSTASASAQAQAAAGVTVNGSGNGEPTVTLTQSQLLDMVHAAVEEELRRQQESDGNSHPSGPTPTPTSPQKPAPEIVATAVMKMKDLSKLGAVGMTNPEITDFLWDWNNYKDLFKQATYIDGRRKHELANRIIAAYQGRPYGVETEVRDIASLNEILKHDLAGRDVDIADANDVRFINEMIGILEKHAGKKVPEIEVEVPKSYSRVNLNDAVRPHDPNQDKKDQDLSNRNSQLYGGDAERDARNAATGQKPSPEGRNGNDGDKTPSANDGHTPEPRPEVAEQSNTVSPNPPSPPRPPQPSMTPVNGGVSPQPPVPPTNGMTSQDEGPDSVVVERPHGVKTTICKGAYFTLNVPVKGKSKPQAIYVSVESLCREPGMTSGGNLNKLSNVLSSIAGNYSQIFMDGEVSDRHDACGRLKLVREDGTEVQLDAVADKPEHPKRKPYDKKPAEENYAKVLPGPYFAFDVEVRAPAPAAARVKPTRVVSPTGPAPHPAATNTATAGTPGVTPATPTAAQEKPQVAPASPVVDDDMQRALKGVLAARENGKIAKRLQEELERASAPEISTKRPPQQPETDYYFADPEREGAEERLTSTDHQKDERAEKLQKESASSGKEAYRPTLIERGIMRLGRWLGVSYEDSDGASKESLREHLKEMEADQSKDTNKKGNDNSWIPPAPGIGRED